MHRPSGQILFPSTPEFPRHSEASAIQLKNGEILLVWSKFTGRGDNATAHVAGVTGDRDQLFRTYIEGDNNRAQIAAAVSEDRGESWQHERVIVENTAGLNVMSPALARLPDGGIGLVYSHRESTTEASRLFRRSDDEGQSWSAPIRITHDGYKTGCHDRFLVLNSGRLIVPLHCTDDWHLHHLHVRVARSDDNGQSWQLSDAVELPKVSDSGESGCIEPDVAQRADGSLLMVIRTAMGTIFRAESHDEGETWHSLRSMEVVAPVAPSLLRRIPGTDDLLLIWNWHYNWRERLGGTRRPLACAISTDGGNSWPWSRRKILEDDPAFTYAYPSCLFINDAAYVTYFVTPEDNPGGQRSLKAVKLPLSWFYS